MWIEATERTPTEMAATDWIESGSTGNQSEPRYQLVASVWMRETNEVTYFGGDTAWEECRSSDSGAQKFWKFAPS